MGRIKSKASVSATKDITRIFEDEEDDGDTEENYRTGDREFSGKNADIDDQDDMDDFITDDEASEEESSGSSKLSGGGPKAVEKKKPVDYLSSKLSLISESKWRDINYLFGNGSDYSWAMTANNSGDIGVKSSSIQAVETERPANEVKLDDVYDTREIEMNMLTEQDGIIRSKDIPERFQCQDVCIDSNKRIDYQLIVRFVYSKLLDDHNEIHRLGKIPYADLASSISKVLKYIHVSAFEIPYIYYYRRDYLHPNLTMDDLWKIYDLDVKYSFFDRRKSNLRSLYDKMISDASIKPDPLFEEFFAASETEDHIEDLSAYLNFNYYKEISEIDEKSRVSFKRIHRLPQHELAKRAGIDGLAKLFNIDIYGIGFAFTQNIDSDYPISHHKIPGECAKEYVCSDFPTVDDALAGARKILMHAFGSHPKLRAFVRGFAPSKASVTVNLTPKGVHDIDSVHPYYSFKYITSKKLNRFVDGQFAQMVSAENEGLLTIMIDIGDKDTLVKNLKDRIQSGSKSDLDISWDEQRALVAEGTFEDILFPEMRRFVRKKLLSEANSWIIKQCEKSLEEKINMAPYGRDGDEGTTRAPRVLAASWGDGGADDPTYFVGLKKTGGLHDSKIVYRFRQVAANPNSPEAQELLEFIKSHNPSVIAMAGFRPNLKTQFCSYIIELIRVWKETGKLEKAIPAFIINDEIPRIYMNSKISSIEFPGNTHHPMMKYCVSLGRYVQDPLVETSRLFNRDNDITSLSLSALQNLVSAHALLQSYERVFVNIASMCGVDINNAVKHGHASSVLQFIPGLGTRKAQALLSKLKLNGLLKSRTDLIRRKLCGANIFMNCAAFIRIRPRHFKNDLDGKLDVLDDTRIHPEDYDLARKMAADALDIDESILDYEENQSQHVKELMESRNIEKLSQLALDEFAIELEKRINEKKKLILHDIVNELLHPFREKRPPFRPATQEQIFVMVTNETPEAIYEGLIIPAQITSVGERMLKCKLDCGIDCILHARNTKSMGIPLTEVFAEHQTILCKIIKLDIDRLQAELSLRDLDTLKADNRVPVDESFDVSRQVKDLITMESSHGAGHEHKQKRSINHPLFQNLDQSEAFSFLFSKPQGSIVIYPSRENDIFYISCKIAHISFLTIRMEITTKLNADRSTGTIFTINGKGYSEIDQIIAEHVDPLVRRIFHIYRHPKFKNISYNEMFNFLESQCSMTNRSCYGFIPDNKSPENILLVYRHPMNKIRSDIITAVPEGYTFRKRNFGTIDEMVRFFKENETTKSRDHRRQHDSHFPKDYRGNTAGYTVRVDTAM